MKRTQEGRPYDTQRQRVYDAEKPVKKGYGERLETVAEMQAFVDRITRSHFWKKHHHTFTKQVKVKDGRGRKRACGDVYYIKMPLWARFDLYVLHELTHSLVESQPKHVRYYEAIHGRLFCRFYLGLVKRFMGNETHAALKAMFKQKGVKTSRLRSYTRKQLLHLTLVSKNGGEAYVTLLHDFNGVNYNSNFEVRFFDGDTVRFWTSGSEVRAIARFRAHIGELVLDGWLPKS